MSRKNDIKDLIDLFFSDTTIGIMKEKYGPYWYQNEFIPYVQSMGADNENYKRISSSTRKNPESWDTTICVALLVYDEKYSRLISEENKKDFKYLKKIRNDFAHSNVRDGDITESEYGQYVQKLRNVANTLIDRCDYSSEVRSKLKLAARRTTNSTGYGNAGSYSYVNTGSSSYRSNGSNSYRSASNYSSYANNGYSSYNGASNASYGNTNIYTTGSAGAYAYNSSSSKNNVELGEEKQTVFNEAAVKECYRVRDNIYVGLSLVTLIVTIVGHLSFFLCNEYVIAYTKDYPFFAIGIGFVFLTIVGWRGALGRWFERNKSLNISRFSEGRNRAVFRGLFVSFMCSLIQSVVYTYVYALIISKGFELFEIRLEISEDMLFLYYAVLISFVRCYGKLIIRVLDR